jgi:glycosyltransferase 2 family protein
MSRKWLAVALKAAISLLLIWFLLGRVDLAKVLERVRHLGVADALLCIAVLTLQTGLVTVRWSLVARMIRMPLELWTALRILVIGMFFNQTLPSSVGGDAVRVWLLTREKLPLGKAVNVVLCDRVVGLIMLVALIGATLPLMDRVIPDPATRTTLSLVAGVGIVAFLAFLVIGEQVAALLRRWRYTRPFGNLATDLRELFLQPLPTAGLLVLSAFIHLLTVASAVLLAWGMALNLSYVDCLIVIPTVMLVTTLPISIAGWGVREGAMVAGFGFLGVSPDDALALSVLFGLVQIAISLPGGVVWLAHRPPGAMPELAASTDA